MKLSVILVISFEKPQLVSEALAAVFASRSDFAFEVIVVDNASSDAASALLPFADRLKIIRNSENLGFTRANNRGVAAAQGEYLLFLNSDTRISPDTLSLLVAFADAHPQAGAVGPLVLNGDGTFQLSFGRPFSLLSEFWQKAIASRRARRTDPEKLKAREVGWVSGCCLLTRREYFPAGKVFDEDIFLYFDDSELCTRLGKMGRKVYFFPGTSIVHYGGASVSSLPARTAVEYRRSQLHIYRKHLPGWQSWLLSCYLAVKFRRRMRRARDENEKQAAACVLELLKKK
jgi:GT2 family glycosyltransferase